MKMKKRLMKIHKERSYLYLILFVTVILIGEGPSVYAQNNELVQGTVTDTNTDDTMPGVNILVKGTTTGAATDANGNYELTVGSLQDTLVVSFVGYQTRQVSINGRTEIDVALQPKAFSGEEMVVVGYGEQKKKNLTGAIDVATSKSIENKAVMNTGDALQGVIPNLNISVTSGKPGAKPSYNIRGFESINGGSPLFLVDGIPRDPSTVDPKNIKDITVLKDASSSAIYGARAAFGVVLIQTKEAEPGKFRVSLDAQFSVERPIWHNDPVTNPYTFTTWLNKASLNKGGRKVYPDFVVNQAKKWSQDPRPENAWITNKGTLYYTGGKDVSDEFLGNFSPKQNYHLTSSGGTEDANYYASFGFQDEKGFIKINPRKFKRYNLITDAKFSVGNWLTLNSNIQFNSTTSDSPHNYNGVSWTDIIRMNAANYGGRFPSTKYFDAPNYPGRDYSDYEGMWIHKQNFAPYYEQGGRHKINNNDLYITQKATINPLERLEIRGGITYKRNDMQSSDRQIEIQKLKGGYNGKIDLLQDEMIGPGYSEPSYVKDNYSRENSYILNALAEYEFNESQNPHYFKGMVGFNQEWLDYKSGGLTGYDMISSSVPSINATVGDQRINSSQHALALRGIFGRLNYTYDDRYLVEVNGRYDGSSRFSKDDRFGFFPSFSGGWRISEETFMKRIDFLSNLKLRGSYGRLGNQDVASYYPYISTMNIGKANYLMNGNRISYVSSPGLVSPSLTWEKTETINIGMDIGLFDNKLTASFDKYTRSTKDMLMNVNYPDLLGTSAPKENAADLKTRGWEFQVAYRNTISNDFNYQVSINISDNLTEITKYNNPNGSLNDYYKGQKIGEIWGYETVGIFQSEQEVENAADQTRLGVGWGPGDIHFKDLDGDGKITPGEGTIDNPGDRRIIGNTTPRYSYGLDLNANYKGLSVGLFIQGVGKRDYDATSGGGVNWFWPFNSSLLQKYALTESWSENNRDAYFPIPSRFGTKNKISQSRYIQNAAYLRLKNLTVSYELPNKMLSTIGLNRLQIYISAFNLAELTKIHKPLDPEYVYTSNLPYPLQRTYSIGTRIKF